MRKGRVGGVFTSGECVLTVSGRVTSPFPRVDLSSRGKASNTVTRVTRWLMSEAVAEAEARGDRFARRLFECGMSKPQQADKDGAELYLFEVSVCR